MREERVTRLLTILIPTVLLIAGASTCLDCTTDDAFISFRYASNLAKGNGLVFNPGERVEGFSNLLWILLLSVFGALGANIVLLSKILGIACAVLTLWVTFGILKRHLQLPFALTLLALSYLATSVGMVYYSISGMETVFYALLVTLLNYLLLEKRWLGAAIICGSLILTRPEGFLFLAPLALALFLERPPAGRALRAIVIPIAVLGLLVIWRWVYYGSLLPNSFLKINTSLTPIDFVLSHTKRLISYTFLSFARQEGLLFLSILGMVILFARRTLPMIASLGVIAFFIWYSGGDWMGFSRFYVPGLPLIVAFCFAGAARILSVTVGGESLPRTTAVDAPSPDPNVGGESFPRWNRRPLVFAALCIPLLFSAYNTYRSVKELRAGQVHAAAMHSVPQREAGRHLKQVGSPGDLVAAAEIGALGYCSGLPVLDLYGLTDPTMAEFRRQARRGGTPNQSVLRQAADYVLSRSPRFVLLTAQGWPSDPGFSPADRALYEAMLETARYRPERTFPMDYNKTLILFARRKPEARW